MFDSGDHFHRTAAFTAGLDVDIEHTLEPFRQGHSRSAEQRAHRGTVFADCVRSGILAEGQEWVESRRSLISNISAF